MTIYSAEFVLSAWINRLLACYFELLSDMPTYCQIKVFTRSCSELDKRTRWPRKTFWILMAAASALVNSSFCGTEGDVDETASWEYSTFTVSSLVIASSVELVGQVLRLPERTSRWDDLLWNILGTMLKRFSKAPLLFFWELVACMLSRGRDVFLACSVASLLEVLLALLLVRDDLRNFLSAILKQFWVFLIPLLLELVTTTLLVGAWNARLACEIVKIIKTKSSSWQSNGLIHARCIWIGWSTR